MPAELRDQLQDALGDAYRITRELGGGMARLFVATESSTGETVVVKALPPDLSGGVSLDRFRREIEIAGRLNHPRVVPVLNAGQQGKLLWYTMPFMGRESLRELLVRERQLPVDRAVAIARDVAEALEYAHQQNTVHRDIKPDNILIDDDGRAIVVDFGIARAIEKSADIVSVTSTGLTLGTPAYMSPEQAAGNVSVDGRSDIYSLACVVYEMLAGEPPFTGPTAQAIIARQINEPPRSLRVIRPGVPPGVEYVLEKALAKNAADRWGTPGEFAEALRNPPRESIEGVSADVIRRNRRLVAATGFVTIGLAAWAIWGSSWGVDTPASLDPRRIAVLDFEDLSSEGRLGHISSGIAMSLVRELRRVDGIQVLSRNALLPVTAPTESVDSMARRLGVGSIVEGSVRPIRNRLLVSIQLVDGSRNAVIDSATFQRDTAELYLLDDDLAREVAALLRRRIGETIRVREAIAGTTSAIARELVFRAEREREQGVTETRRRGSSTPRLAEMHFRRADSLLAEAELADGSWGVPVFDRSRTWFQITTVQAEPARAQSFARALSHAERAVTRWPNDARAYEARGYVLYWEAARRLLPDSLFRIQLKRAEDDLGIAIRLDSSLVSSWGTRALVRVARGEMSEAEHDATRALAKDTYLAEAPSILTALYAATLMKGAYADSWRWCEAGARDYPKDPRFLQCRIALMAEDTGRSPDAARATRWLTEVEDLDPPSQGAVTGRAPVHLYRQLMVAAVHARAGNAARARDMLDRVTARVGKDRELRTDVIYDIAYVRLRLGERQEALRLLAEYLAERPSLRDLTATHPRWAALRSDSTFERITTGAR